MHCISYESALPQDMKSGGRWFAELLGGDAEKGDGSSGMYNPAAVDVWAMGVILYLSVAGVYPFENDATPDDMRCVPPLRQYIALAG
eukprot:1194283-Prorocentrum_minimum.AAC.1